MSDNDRHKKTSDWATTDIKERQGCTPSSILMSPDMTSKLE